MADEQRPAEPDDEHRREQDCGGAGAAGAPGDVAAPVAHAMIIAPAPRTPSNAAGDRHRRGRLSQSFYSLDALPRESRLLTPIPAPVQEGGRSLPCPRHMHSRRGHEGHASSDLGQRGTQNAPPGRGAQGHVGELEGDRDRYQPEIERAEAIDHLSKKIVHGFRRSGSRARGGLRGAPIRGRSSRSRRARRGGGHRVWARASWPVRREESVLFHHPELYARSRSSRRATTRPVSATAPPPTTSRTK